MALQLRRSFTSHSARALLLLAAAPLVAGAQTLPTPESVLGHTVGQDFHLATYEESLSYFQQLAAASDRVELREIGRTSNDRPWYIALISSPENLANVERYREIAQRLAHPEGLSDDAARALAREGKAIVHIDGGLHATEVAHAQHTIQLAYDLASETSNTEILAILDNVVLLLWPSINPDGQTMVADWYHSNLGTPFEVSGGPFLYQKYVGHDNNRDGYMINMIESRVVTRVDREWEPQILYNHHQTAPFPTRIWIPPFAEPISPYVHPLMWRTVNLVGMAMAQALEERGQKGAMHMGTGFDNWYPGFMDHANNFHNVASFLTETALYRYATPGFYTVQDFPPQRRDLRPQSLYSSPWEGGWWRLRDAVDYMLTASISVLDVAAKYKEDLLYNRYQAGRDVIAHHREAPPYGFFIPQDQRDPVAAVELLRRLAFNGVEVYQLSSAVTFDGLNHPAGTWMIPMDQPFANFVRQLFAVQDYPDLREFPDGPPDQPYDVAGWTLPYQMGVRVVEAASPLNSDVRGAMQPVEGEAVPWAQAGDAAAFDTPPGVGFNTNAAAAGIVPPPGRVSGGGAALVLDPAQNNSFKALNRAWNEGARVRVQPGANGSSARYLVTGLSDASARRMAADLALRATRTGTAGTEITRPRIGLYRPWAASMDEGWTRWVLERYDFDFTNIYNADVRAGRLDDRFDVIVIADIGARQILNGSTLGSVPPRYAGGIGPEGVRELDGFVRRGGTLVTLNGSSEFAIDELHLPVRNVVADLDREEFFLPLSIVEMDVDPSHPIMGGMEAKSKIIVDGSPVFTVEDEFEGQALAKYSAEGSPLLSGYLLGEEHLKGYATALDVHHGDGHVILLGMRPQWRAQPFDNFRILFNAALYSRAVAATVTPNTDFWEAPEEPDEDEDEDDPPAEGEGRRGGQDR
ncbi:MAG: M14 family zinc carboxypeptidase [Longimicrobiales bacterium]